MAKGIAAFLALFLGAVWFFHASYLWMPGQSVAWSEEKLSAEESRLEASLRRHVSFLVDTGERHMGAYENLRDAAAYIEQQFYSSGYEPKRQGYLVGDQKVWNLEVEIPGGDLVDEILVLGAHYDTVPGSPGANDNASGVAALLTLAHEMRDFKPLRTIRFIAFVNEENPYAGTDKMGSVRYAQS